MGTNHLYNLNRLPESNDWVNLPKVLINNYLNIKIRNLRNLNCSQELCEEFQVIQEHLQPCQTHTYHLEYHLNPLELVDQHLSNDKPGRIVRYDCSYLHGQCCWYQLIEKTYDQNLGRVALDLQH